MSNPLPILEIQFHLDDDAIPSNQKNPSIKKDTTIEPYVNNHIHEDAASSNLSFHYSGRHDHGSNAMLKEGGYYSSMISSLYEAKEESNTILSGEIEKQKERENGNQKKKTRVNEADAYA